MKKSSHSPLHHWHLKLSFIRPPSAAEVITQRSVRAAVPKVQPPIDLNVGYLAGVGPLIWAPKTTYFLCVFSLQLGSCCITSNQCFSASDTKHTSRTRRSQGQQCQGYRQHCAALLTWFQLIIILWVEPLFLAGTSSGNEVINGCCSTERHWLCPSQEIRMLHLNSLFGVWFLVFHAWFGNDLCHYILWHQY